MFKAAEHIKETLLKAGADHAEVKETSGWPVVYGHKMLDESLPTVLVYGHYDVQPAEPLDLWDSPPFEPEVRDGKIFARGADDDKGQLFMHVKAFELMNAQGTLTCNVKFMIEGEEEIGSPSLKAVLQREQGTAQGRYHPDFRYHHDCTGYSIHYRWLKGTQLPGGGGYRTQPRPAFGFVWRRCGKSCQPAGKNDRLPDR